MPKGYHHLTRDQRCQLYALKCRGTSTHNIADTLGVHRSAIYRELKRNTGQRGYRYSQAQEKASERKKNSAQNNLKMTPKLISAIDDKLRLQWSPEQISGWLRRQNSDGCVSHEIIYRHVCKCNSPGHRPGYKRIYSPQPVRLQLQLYAQCLNKINYTQGGAPGQSLFLEPKDFRPRDLLRSKRAAL